MITPSTVKTLHDGKTKKVKNLSWFLKHSRYVKALQFKRTPEHKDEEGLLIVTLAIGNDMPTHEYKTGYACENVLKDLLNRSQWLREIPLEII